MQNKMIKPKLKKADMMPEEALKILLATLGIVLLLYLAFSFYGIFLDKTKVEQARVVLDDISAKLAIVNGNETLSYLIVSPKDWTIYIFNKTETSPFDCKNSFCLCLCSKFSVVHSEQAELCDDNGLCKKSAIPLYAQSLNGNYFRLRTLPRVIYLQNRSGDIFISGASDLSSELALNMLVSSSELKKLIVDIFISGNKTEIEMVKTAVGSKMKAEDWDLFMIKDLGVSKESIRITSNNIDPVYYSVMLQYAPKKNSFVENNITYNLEMRSAQYE